MKTKSAEQTPGTASPRRVLVKGKRMVMLEEAAYEALCARRTCGNRICPPRTPAATIQPS